MTIENNQYLGKNFFLDQKESTPQAIEVYCMLSQHIHDTGFQGAKSNIISLS